MVVCDPERLQQNRDSEPVEELQPPLYRVGGRETFLSGFPRGCVQIGDAGSRDVEVAEGEGFVPSKRSHINALRAFSIAQITRNAQNLSIRYKISTAD